MSAMVSISVVMGKVQVNAYGSESMSLRGKVSQLSCTWGATRLTGYSVLTFLAGTYGLCSTFDILDEQWQCQLRFTIW